MQKKALLVDLDGTMLDTSQDFLNAFGVIAEQYSLPMPTLDALKCGISGGIKGMLQASLKDKNDPRMPEFSKLFLSAYEKTQGQATQLYPGFEQVLDFVKKNNIPFGVVTNKFEYLADQLLKSLNLRNELACLVGGDTAARAKPFPDPLLLALAQLNIQASEAIYVGDSKRDIEAAQACGMPALAAAYGYLTPEDNPHEWGAEAVIHTASEIIPFMLQDTKG